MEQRHPIEEPKKRGRKNYYDEKIKPSLARITELYKEGYTEKQIMDSMGICSAAWYKHKSENPEFMEAIKKGNEQLLDEIEASLWRRAKGYEYTEEKNVTETMLNGVIKEKKETVRKKMAPDVGAIVFALTNRRAETWKNKQVQEPPDSGLMKDLAEAIREGRDERKAKQEAVEDGES